MENRYYSPELCRFIQPNNIEYLDPSSINGLNLYCYCKNNPIMYVDPSGHMPEWAMWVIGGVLLVGSIALTIATGGAAAGSALLNVGSGLAAYGKLGKLGYAGIQGLITGGFSWGSVGLSAMFGFAGGAIGITKWGEGIRNIIVGAGLGLGESSIGEMIEWWQSRKQTNMAYLRFAY